VLQQLTLADDASAMLDEIEQNIEYLRLDLDRLTGAAQFITARVEFMALKGVYHLLTPHLLPAADPCVRYPRVFSAAICTRASSERAPPIFAASRRDV
jgi:hypothetical protein